MFRIAPALILIAALRAQAPDPPRFEVASIRLVDRGASVSSGIATGHGKLDGRNVTVKRCIVGAYNIGPHQLSGGPEWVNTVTFDITAKAEKPTGDDAVLMSMLQTLLAERFKLVLHRETKEMRALVLEVAKGGPKLEQAPPGDSGNSMSNDDNRVTLASHNVDMASFARVLSRATDLPVIDKTGLTGIFNLKLHWVRDDASSAKNAASSDDATIYTAIQEQLGLRLRSEKLPVEVYVIDSVEKPSEN